MTTPTPPILPRWGFVFLACPAWLTEEQRDGLVRLAFQTYLHDAPRTRFDWDGCSGELEATSDTVALGSFIGQRFTARADTPRGEARVEFLVAEAQLRAAAAVVAEA
ncbi:hypothetical protein L6R50_27660 [Myxococcota bacterium]|nr:hypothetical protein [Myxococcota bacterium]